MKHFDANYARDFKCTYEIGIYNSFHTVCEKVYSNIVSQTLYMKGGDRQNIIPFFPNLFILKKKVMSESASICLLK